MRFMQVFVYFYAAMYILFKKKSNTEVIKSYILMEREMYFVAKIEISSAEILQNFLSAAINKLLSVQHAPKSRIFLPHQDLVCSRISLIFDST